LGVICYAGGEAGREQAMTAKRIISLLVGIVAVIVGLYLVLSLSVLIFIQYGDPAAPNLKTAAFALVPLCFGVGCLYEAYRFIRFFFKKK
jgi:hypothetical protein